MVLGSPAFRTTAQIFSSSRYLPCTSSVPCHPCSCQHNSLRNECLFDEAQDTEIALYTNCLAMFLRRSRQHHLPCHLLRFLVDSDFCFCCWFPTAPRYLTTWSQITTFVCFRQDTTMLLSRRQEHEITPDHSSHSLSHSICCHTLLSEVLQFDT